jgi:hypothetical protein
VGPQERIEVGKTRMTRRGFKSSSRRTMLNEQELPRRWLSGLMGTVVRKQRAHRMTQQVPPAETNGFFENKKYNFSLQ